MKGFGGALVGFQHSAMSFNAVSAIIFPALLDRPVKILAFNASYPNSSNATSVGMYPHHPPFANSAISTALYPMESALSYMYNPYSVKYSPGTPTSRISLIPMT